MVDISENSCFITSFTTCMSPAASLHAVTPPSPAHQPVCVSVRLYVHLFQIRGCGARHVEPTAKQRKERQDKKRDRQTDTQTSA
mmetsp:Transcript_28967/g.83700  ORF Transcript_28967/g.83700 Transcript_28967/m.83700 type:complete len:84 (-) Transcript_28967:67-318(-)